LTELGAAFVDAPVGNREPDSLAGLTSRG
jgi:hypothetical protein